MDAIEQLRRARHRRQVDQVDAVDHLFPCCDGYDGVCSGERRHVISSVYALKQAPIEIGTFCDRCGPQVERLARRMGVRVTVQSPVDGLG